MTLDCQHVPQDPRSTEDLIQYVLAEKDEDAAHDAIVVLQFRADQEVLDQATKLCQSTVAVERELGAVILGQLGIPKRVFPEECFQALRRMLEQETDSAVLNAIGIAFGHLRESRAISLLISLKEHPDPDVRYGVVFGLMCQEEPAAVNALINLSRDEELQVRDWATFALGSQIDLDSSEIRNALLSRLDDCDDQTRNEALVGLARRKDLRVIEPLIRELSLRDPSPLAVEAAEELGSSKLYQVLQNLKFRWETEGYATDKIDRALVNCTRP